MQQQDGSIQPISEWDAEVVRKVAAAGNREVPIFEIGEVIQVRSGRFRVLAFGGHLLVLEGVPLTTRTKVEEDDEREAMVRDAKERLARAEAMNPMSSETGRVVVGRAE